MKNLKVQGFDLTDSKIKIFLDIHSSILGKWRHWVPSLRISTKEILNPKHVFWKSRRCHLILISSESRFLGRAAIVINDNNKATFGFFDVIDDYKVAETLLNYVVKKAKAFGAKEIIGPFSPGFNYELGILSEGYSSYPKFMMPWNPPYYGDFFRKHGWKTATTFAAYDLKVESFNYPESMTRVKNYLNDRYTISFRSMDFKNLDQEVQYIYTIYNQAFSEHWGYQHFSLAEIKMMAKDLKFIANPDLMFFVLLNGEIVGFIIALPDLNEIVRNIKDGKLFPTGWLKILLRRKDIKEVRVLNVAVKDKFRKMGIGSLLYYELYKRMRSNGFINGELSWVEKDNLSMNNAIKAMGGKQCKEYTIFKYTL